MIYIHNRKARQQTRNVIGAFIEIAAALVKIFTLGFIYPTWDMRWMVAGVKRDRAIRVYEMEEKL